MVPAAQIGARMGSVSKRASYFHDADKRDERRAEGMQNSCSSSPIPDSKGALSC